MARSQDLSDMEPTDTATSQTFMLVVPWFSHAQTAASFEVWLLCDVFDLLPKLQVGILQFRDHLSSSRS